MRKRITWLDNNLLPILLGLYVFFIPLYPKWPLRMVNYTYIAIRLEDVFVALLYVVFIVQILRKKVRLSRTYLWLFIAFWVAATISFLSGFYLTNTVRINSVGLLNVLRRVEYMGVFFVFASVITTPRLFFRFVYLMVSALVIVTLYGLGQKYLGWPAVQTMNPEYAKGYVLILDSWARISSTFGGHYDLAAYLIFLMPAVMGLFYGHSRWFFTVFLLALSNLVLTASRVSYGAYIASLFPFLLITRKWIMFIVVIACTVSLTLLSSNLTNRLTRTFQTKQIFIDKDTGQTTVPRRLKPDDLPPGDFVLNKQSAKDNAVDLFSNGQATIDLNSKDAVEVKMNLRDQIREEAKLAGRTLTIEEENRLVEEAFRNMKVVSSIVPDISVATRLQVEWPRAINAFLRYPLFGAGPSSITEATDNDYLRWLGEFGLVGTLIFMTILTRLWLLLWKVARLSAPRDRMFFYGLLAGYFGLLVNATYIDVFEASKVAFHFWMVMGMVVGYASTTVTTKKVKKMAYETKKSR